MWRMFRFRSAPTEPRTFVPTLIVILVTLGGLSELTPSDKTNDNTKGLTVNPIPVYPEFNYPPMAHVKATRSVNGAMHHVPNAYKMLYSIRYSRGHWLMRPLPQY